MDVSIKQVEPLMQLDYAGLLYERGSRNGNRRLSELTRKTLLKCGFERLSEGGYRQVFKIQGKPFVLKINYGFWRGDANYLCRAESLNYKKYSAKVASHSSGKVRLAETILISPNIVIQEYAGHVTPSYDEISGVSRTLGDIGFKHTDIKSSNCRSLDGSTLVIDLAA